MYIMNIHPSTNHRIHLLRSNWDMDNARDIVLHSSLPPITGRHRDFAIRFRMALQYAGLMGYDPESKSKFGSFEKVANKRGMPYKRAFIGNLYRGEQLPEQSKYAAVAKALGVDQVWLQTGSGAMVGSRDYNQVIEELPAEVRKAIDAIIKTYTDDDSA